jgi:hypothetical protein
MVGQTKRKGLETVIGQPFGKGSCYERYNPAHFNYDALKEAMGLKG